MAAVIPGASNAAAITTTLHVVQTLSILPSRPPTPSVPTSTVTGTLRPTPVIDPKKRTVAERRDLSRPDKLKANPIVFGRRT